MTNNNAETTSQFSSQQCINNFSRHSILKAETREKLLKKLEKFEKSNLFLKNSISLDEIASYCHTNKKYISHIINFYKKRDYNNYINELRVNYIVKKLKSEILYRKFKIAVLAKEAGFSSPGKFSNIFKNKMGILPSEFIKKLK